MEKIQLERRTMEFHCGRSVDKAPALLARWENREGYIPSEADIRILGVRNFNNAPKIATTYWDTSTLSATKGDVIKVILPYEAGSKTLTESARFGLSLINPNELLVKNGVSLDIDGRWEKLKGNGVYTLKRKGLILNQDLKEAEAMKHELLLIKLGHPDYVDSKFARSADEVAEIISKTFRLGKQEHSCITMMGQYLPGVSNRGILKAWLVSRLDNCSGSNAMSNLDHNAGRFAFVGDDKARDQLKTLEEMIKPEQIDQIIVALNERDQLRKKLLSTDQIYSAVQAYVGSANESEVRKVLDKLTSQ